MRRGKHQELNTDCSHRELINQCASRNPEYPAAEGVQRQQSTDRNGPHTAQPPRKHSTGEALQLLPTSATLPRAASARGAGSSSALLVARGVGLAVSSCQTVLIILWKMLPGDSPKLLEGFFIWQTLAALPTLHYHTVIPGKTALLQEGGKLPRSWA